MAVAYNYKKGIDSPVWQYLAFFPAGNSNTGSSNVYDGRRYLYWLIQTGTTATAVSTTVLYRYDTWSNSWQYLANTTSGNQGMDLEYDSIRNVLYIMHGGSLNSWQVFNLNTTAVTIVNQSCPAWTLTNVTVLLPVGAVLGSSFTQPSDDAVPTIIDSGIADSVGQTTTNVVANIATGTFAQGMVNLQIRILTGAQAGQLRTISAVSPPTSLTVTPALPAALASGDTFQIELVADVATATTVTAITDITSNWTINGYANMDVIMTNGVANGQRRRIASNTATVLTLASTVTGNARTGPFSTAPGQTDSYKIVPSSDFLYFQPGNGSTALYKLDVVATTGTAWVSLAAAPAGIAGGGNTFYPAAYAPYQIVAMRGAATGIIYTYNIGTNTWTTLTTYTASENFNTGASSAMLTGKRKLIIQKEGSTRVYALDLLTGILEPAGTMPYAAPAAYDGKRARVVTTPDGAKFLYIMRAGGPEFFRVPLEWID